MSGKKVLVTGALGMLGSNLLKYLNLGELVGYDSKKLDITKHSKVKKILKKEKPDIIIHAGANTNVEECEKNKDKTFLINTIGTQNLINYCVGKDILFIFISSTGIYGTKKESQRYNEFDCVNPTTIHHKSKYEAEKLIEKHLSKFIIIRTGWLFGGDKNHNKNFVYKRYLEAKSTKSIKSDNTQIGNPTYIRDLIKQIELIVKNGQYGIYNCVNKAENISRYDYVSKIVELFALNCKVKIASKGEFKRVAQVSSNESALNYKLNLLELNTMEDWSKALQRYIDELKKEI